MKPSTGRPSTKAKTAGMDWTRICDASIWFWSTSILTSLTAPLAARTAFSSAGVSWRQGPHHAEVERQVVERQAEGREAGKEPPATPPVQPQCHAEDKRQQQQADAPDAAEAGGRQDFADDLRIDGGSPAAGHAASRQRQPQEPAGQQQGDAGCADDPGPAMLCRPQCRRRQPRLPISFAPRS